MSWLLLAASATALTAPRRTAVAPRAAVALQGRSDAQLKRGIAEFYDESSGIWEDVWGEHMHHGWYEPGEKAGTMERDVAAQSTMIDKALELCGAADVAARCEAAGRPMRILDVGCGIGGSSRHMARRFAGAQATCVGLTLSPEQARRGNELSREAGLDVTLEARDATNTTFADGSFDLVWSMESGEHMPDKAKFVAELGRLCAPGGRVSVVTWCHRDLQRGRKLNAQRGVTARGVRDWTANIAPFWPAVARSSLKWSSLKKLRKTGLKTIRGAVAILFMILGYKLGTVKFVAVAAAKDEAPGDAKWAWSGPVF
ncbi:sterol 24-C-methyltransferase [Aureococcus anophagefferens]|uniref:Sterol 24-C-methyltransferase n=1 Tax=Aureococcus anophagefferens TaxID=44056 RepID=A0ABR1FM01_AURAN